MSRLLLLAALLCLAAACSEEEERQPPGAAPAGEASPQKTYKWRMATTWPKNFPGLGQAPERLAERVRQMSGGRLDIKVYGAGELVPALEVFDAVSQGTAQLGNGAAYYWKGKVPMAQFFATVPFGLTAQEMNGWLYFGGGMELWRRLYAPYGLVPLAAGNTGVQMGGWFNREVNSLADVEGLKIRMPGLGGEALGRAGATAVNMPGGEIFTSMQTGVVDAAEWVGPYNDLAFGLHQVASLYYYPGWQEPGPNIEMIVNKAAWDSLPPDLQAILETAAMAGNAELLAEYTARNSAAMTELMETHGVQFRRFPDDLLAEIQRLSQAATAEMVPEDDPLAQEIYESWRSYSEAVQAYHEISERAYINARAARAAQPAP